MEHAKMLHALAESFGFAERPSKDDPARFRAWERAQTAINRLVAGQVEDSEIGHTIRVIVLTCGQLEASEPQAYAACLASAMGIDIRSVIASEEAA